MEMFSGAGETLGVTNRRQLLRGSALAGGIALFGSTPAAATTAGGLSLRRQAAYRALVETVACIPGTLVDAARSGEVTAQVAERYRRASSLERMRMEAALDVLSERQGRAFSELSRIRRVTRLLKLLDTDGAPDMLSAQATRVVDAIALAAAPFHPTGFRWRASTAELWVRAARAATAKPREAAVAA